MTGKEVLVAWNDRYSQQDVVGCMEYMAKDLRRIGDTTGWQPVGLERWQPMQENFFKGFPDWHWTMESIIADGDHVVCEFLEHGTFTEPYPIRPGIVLEPTGESYEEHSSIHFLVNADRKIQEIRAHFTNNIERIYGFGKRVAEAGFTDLKGLT